MQTHCCHVITEKFNIFLAKAKQREKKVFVAKSSFLNLEMSTCWWMEPTDLLALAIEVNEGVAGRGDVLRRCTLVHAVDVEVETTVGVHQQTQHRPLRTRVQVRAVVLTDLEDHTGKVGPC